MHSLPNACPVRSLAVACMVLPCLAAFAADSAEHWAFRPIADPAVPQPMDKAWTRGSIDHFILAKLESGSLAPAPVAERRTLIRRAYFDLVGLPPTYEQVEAFAADQSPDAFAKVVDRLLASPHYGERWGRYWLDIARYSDTLGYLPGDVSREYPYAYAYRDWVIHALNEDMPYDRFLLYQIAADQITPEEKDKRHLAAMGFLSVGRRFLNRQADIIDDRIDVVFRGTMALTMSCARCHDHKFDPIPTADYYSLYGVFASSHEPKPADLPLLGSHGNSPELAEFEKGLKEKEAKVGQFFEKRLSEMRQPEKLRKYLLAAHDGRDLDKERLKKLAAERGLIQHVVERWRNILRDTAKAHNPVFAPWHAAVAVPPEQFAAKVKEFAQHSDPQKPVHPKIVEAVAAKDFDSADEFAGLYADLLAKSASGHEPLKPFREALMAATGIDHDALFRLFSTPDQQRVRRLRRAIGDYKATAKGAPPRGMVLLDKDRPSEPHVFERGDPGRRGKKVPRQFPAIVAGKDRKPFSTGSGRLEMAREVANPRNPLTARVIVNRVWHHHFGRGFVDTPSDFGVRTPLPTHADLLDHLAARFMRENWSLKKLHRHILLSATWQQASAHANAAAEKVDPENRLLWRMNRARLDFEAFRDSLLKAAGYLDPTIGGRPVALCKEPFPNRRTVYGRVDRQNLPNLFRTFDFASPDHHSPQRHETTVPQQALFVMNSPFVEEQVGRLIEAPLTTSEAPEERIRALYRRILGRDPDGEEMQAGLAYVTSSEATATSQTATPWSYGYGSFDGEVRFTRLPHFKEGSWQGSEQFPDPELNWATIRASGGHPGNKDDQSVIWRWTAPRAGSYEIRGTVHVPHEASDGVRVRVVRGARHGVFDKASPSTRKTSVTVPRIELAEGEVLDFIVGAGATATHDSFEFVPNIRNLATKETWIASKQFSGPAPRRVGVWHRYAHALLSTNEFAFVD